MIKKWDYYHADTERVKEVAEKHSVSMLLAKILVNRGLNSDEDINKFLNPQIEDLNDPFLLNDMEIAVDRILRAKDMHEKITIYGDYDVDGITSIAVLYQFLKELNIETSYYLPSRLEEGYGLNNDAIEKIKDDGTTLLITVDCGISAYNEIEFAKTLGMDVIVTDHHECPAQLPNAIAVIDPKRADSTYPFNSLAGVGVSFKLIHAISIRLELDRKSYLKYLDIVCLGTVADIVPLIKENRVIVKYGLMLVKQTKNIGLKELIKLSGYSRIDSSLISFGLAPRMNACGRMGKADLALDLLLTNDAQIANSIAVELNSINRERQEVEKSIFEEAVKQIDDNKLYNDDVIVLGSEGWHHGVIGIVASKITEMYYKPSILVCFEDGIGRGSGRSVEGFDLHSALTYAENTLTKYGGHEMAIGLTIEQTKFEDFKKAINEYAKENLPKEAFPTVKVDSEIDSSMVSIDTIKELEVMEPFGEANPTPIFVYKNMKVDGVRLLSNDRHLKLILKDQTSLYDAIAFNMGNMQYSIKVGDKIDVLHFLEINEYNGEQKVQLNIRDIKKSI